MNRIVDYENLSVKIQNWIINYVETYNIKTLVIGVSGGIDSAVVSTLCALTNIPTITVGIPLNSKLENTNLSKLQLDYLSKYSNVKTFEYDLTKTFNSFETLMSDNFSSDLANANSKSRMRMVTLYHIATNTNGIVVGTGNKVEDFGVGFYTKYGDGGVDISPIADLYKTEVRELGRHLGVPIEIINATPTDGLWDDDRNDESQIGATYEELEWFMEYGINKPSYTGKEHNISNVYQHLNNKNKHKMVPIPIFDLIENKII
jgi:NAD+ synthase